MSSINTQCKLYVRYQIVVHGINGPFILKSGKYSINRHEGTTVEVKDESGYIYEPFLCEDLAKFESVA